MFSILFVTCSKNYEAVLSSFFSEHFLDLREEKCLVSSSSTPVYYKFGRKNGRSTLSDNFHPTLCIDLSCASLSQCNVYTSPGSQLYIYVLHILPPEGKFDGNGIQSASSDAISHDIVEWTSGEFLSSSLS